MPIKRVSIEKNTLLIEVDDLEARILSRTLSIWAPFLGHFIYTMTRLILILAPLGKNAAMGLVERLERGENIIQILTEMEIDPETLFDKSIQFPSEQEIDQALGWLEERRKRWAK